VKSESDKLIIERGEVRMLYSSNKVPPASPKISTRSMSVENDELAAQLSVCNIATPMNCDIASNCFDIGSGAPNQIAARVR
jgi:hypothetical protein